MKTQDASIRHTGAMAQDFRAAFELRETPQGIDRSTPTALPLPRSRGSTRSRKPKSCRYVRSWPGCGRCLRNDKQARHGNATRVGTRRVPIAANVMRRLDALSIDGGIPRREVVLQHR